MVEEFDELSYLRQKVQELNKEVEELKTKLSGHTPLPLDDLIRLFPDPTTEGGI